MVVAVVVAVVVAEAVTAGKGNRIRWLVFDEIVVAWIALVVGSVAAVVGAELAEDAFVASSHLVWLSWAAGRPFAEEA